ncbi:MAG TPA: NAD(P)/FAD-dependent oxidoreductase [Gemmatimonadota bacterium]|nr:NAD(P)/FAD-dependent oxidoreductase [Gemmatimonadota bacterium]
MKPPRVVILGGGFAGLNAARKLKRAPVEVVMVDRENYHLFQPLLYQVATAALNPSDIAYPLRSALRRQKNASVLLADAVAVDVAASRIELDNGSLPYDYLIVATGATHSYFGNEAWARDAPGLKTVEDALEIRRRIFLAYEAAERESAPEARRAWLRFVVVGAGPTGVELAGALAEIGRRTIEEGYRQVDRNLVEVLLVEGLDRVLPGYEPESSSRAKRQLEKLGVNVILESFVTDIDEQGLSIGDRRIETRTVLWAAGVEASRLASSLGAPRDKAGRVKVEPDLSVPGRPNVFVAGDLAHVRRVDRDELVPGVAPAAIQMGEHAAHSIQRLVAGQSTTRFEYVDKGSLATIGRAAAVGEIGRARLSGLIAWLAWLLIHIFYLIGFRNRLWVLAGWAWAYLTFRRGARLITGRRPFDRLPRIER